MDNPTAAPLATGINRMPEPRPLVTVIIPYYSHGRHLHQTVFSALQAYQGPMEILLVNDGSVEPKAEVFISNAQALHPSVRVISKPNGGLSSARNAGLEQASGTFIQFLDSDDLIVPGKIDLQVNQLTISPAFDISISNYILCDESGSEFSRDGDPISRFDFKLDDFLYRWERGFSIPIHCGLFRRQAIEEIRFATNVIGKEDWIFWSRLAHAGRRFAYLPIYGAIYRQHEDGMSKSFQSMGDSWLEAAKSIKQVIGRAHPEFLPSCQLWYDAFYAPRIAQQQKAREAASSQAVQTAPRPQSNPTNQMATKPVAPQYGWIEEAVRVRIPPSAAPLVSGIVPVFNHADRLPECLMSLCAQSVNGDGIEIVIIDDCSSDPAVRPLLEAFAERVAGVKLLLLDSNSGISVAQNLGVDAACGQYLAFVDCDDSLVPGAIQALEGALATGADYLFTDRLDVDGNGTLLRRADYGGYQSIKPGGRIEDDLLDGMIASHLKVISRSRYLDVGGCSRDFAGVQDWELAQRIAAHGGRFQYVPEALYRHRIHQGSVTQSQLVRQYWLSNRVRRDATRIQLRPQIDDIQAVEQGRRWSIALLEADRPPPEKECLVVRELYGPGDVALLKEAWRAGRICVFAPEPNQDLGHLWLVREFNSYFDAILVKDEATACFMAGYLWNHSILHTRFGLMLERSLAAA